jgi:hypothetical protein
MLREGKPAFSRVYRGKHYASKDDVRFLCFDRELNSSIKLLWEEGILR